MGDPLRIAVLSNGENHKIFLFEKGRERQLTLIGNELREITQPKPSEFPSNYARVSRQSILINCTQMQNNLVLRDGETREEINVHRGQNEAPYGKIQLIKF